MSLTIGIIGGTGKQGSVLAKRLASCGYVVRIGSRSEERGKNKAIELNDEINSTNISGGENKYALEADVIYLAIHIDKVESLLYPMSEMLKGKIVVDIINNLEFGKTVTAKKYNGKNCYDLICDLFPDTKVVTSLKTISFVALEGSEPINQADFQITDHDDAFEITSKIATDLTLNPIRIFGKEHAFTIEMMVAMSIQINKHNKGAHCGYQITGL